MKKYTRNHPTKHNKMDAQALVGTLLGVLFGSVVGYLAAIFAFRSRIDLLEANTLNRFIVIEKAHTDLELYVKSAAKNFDLFQARQNLQLQILASIAQKLEVDKRTTDLITKLIVEEIRP